MRIRRGPATNKQTFGATPPSVTISSAQYNRSGYTRVGRISAMQRRCNLPRTQHRHYSRVARIREWVPVHGGRRGWETMRVCLSNHTSRSTALQTRARMDQPAKSGRQQSYPIPSESSPDVAGRSSVSAVFPSNAVESGIFQSEKRNHHRQIPTSRPFDGSDRWTDDGPRSMK